MSSGTTAQDKNWQAREQAEEALHAHKKEQEQLEALRAKLKAEELPEQGTMLERDFEAGFGGQEELEDRYATTSGEH